jgi:hypothetical protein
VQVAGQEAARLLAVPKPVESPVISAKPQMTVPVPATDVSPSRVNRQRKGLYCI